MMDDKSVPFHPDAAPDGEHSKIPSRSFLIASILSPKQSPAKMMSVTAEKQASSKYDAVGKTGGDEAVEDANFYKAGSESTKAVTTNKQAKKPRTTFTDYQIMQLERMFEMQKYLSSVERHRAAEHLGLSETQVKTWFQNRRMKFKRQHSERELQAISQFYGPSPYRSQTEPHNHWHPHPHHGVTAQGFFPLSLPNTVAPFRHGGARLPPFYQACRIAPETAHVEVSHLRHCQGRLHGAIIPITTACHTPYSVLRMRND